MGGILVLAVGLRVYCALAFPYEQDELYTRIEAARLFDSPLVPGIEGRPLYFLLHHVLQEVLPNTPFGLRLPAFIFGILGVVATWFAGRRVGGAEAGIASALLVGISPWHLLASGMARYWSLVYLLAVLFFFALWVAYRADRPRSYLLALTPLVLGSMVHPSFIFAAAGAAVGVTLVREDRVGWRWPSPVALRWLWLPYAAFIAVAAGALRLGGSPDALLNHQGRDLAANLRLIPAMAIGAGLTVCSAAVAGVVILWRSNDPDRRRFAALAVGGIVIAAAALFAAGFKTNVYSDYGIGLLPLIILLSACFVANPVVERSPPRSGLASFGIGLIVLAGVIPSSVSHLLDGSRFDYRWAYERVRAESPDTPVLAFPIILQREYAPDLKGRELRSFRPYLDRVLATDQELWAITSVQRYGLVKDPRGVLAAWLAQHCRLIEGRERKRLDYRQYRVELHRCTPAPSLDL